VRSIKVHRGTGGRGKRSSILKAESCVMRKICVNRTRTLLVRIALSGIRNARTECYNLSFGHSLDLETRSNKRRTLAPTVMRRTCQNSLPPSPPSRLSLPRASHVTEPNPPPPSPRPRPTGTPISQAGRIIAGNRVKSTSLPVK